MALSLQMYAISETPNSDILNDTTTGGPALPTISELSPPPKSRTRGVVRGWRRVMFFIPNGELISDVKHQRHLQPLLADPASTASDVYLVSEPAIVDGNPIGSLYHWSFYTQGVFYHLSAPDLARESVGKSKNASKSINAVCKLKCENLNHISSEDKVRLQVSSSRKLLVAYKVGQTDYKHDQILQLAEWSVRQLSKYGLFSANCQHFATTMVRRTVMRVGDRSAFAGTTLQIVDWELDRGSEPHINGIERGFLVKPPLPVDLSIWSEFILVLCQIFDVRGYLSAGRIKIMYEKGPDAPGAWKPPGYWAMRFRDSGLRLCHSSSELKDDLLRRRWKDALYGRYVQLPDGTMKRPLQRSFKRKDFELNTRSVHP